MASVVQFIFSAISLQLAVQLTTGSPAPDLHPYPELLTIDEAPKEYNYSTNGYACITPCQPDNGHIGRCGISRGGTDPCSWRPNHTIRDARCWKSDSDKDTDQLCKQAVPGHSAFYCNYDAQGHYDNCSPLPMPVEPTEAPTTSPGGTTEAPGTTDQPPPESEIL